MTSISIGYAFEDITPELGIDLGGFDRDRHASEITDPLYVKCLLLDDGIARIAIFSLDLLWVDQALSFELRETAALVPRLRENAVLVSCTHTHSSPELNQNTFYNAKVDSGYRNFVVSQAKKSLSKAIDALAPGTMQWGEGKSKVGINRRRFIIDQIMLRSGRFVRKMANRPNFSGFYDPVLPVIRMEVDSLSRPIYVINYACHPTIMRGESVSADFPGYIAKSLAAKLGEEVEVIFLQGFGGNIRPRLIEKETISYSPGSILRWIFDRLRFQEDTGQQECERIGADLASAVSITSMHEIANIRLSAKITDLDLIYSNAPSSESHQPKNKKLEIQFLGFGAGHYLIAIAAEVFSEYSIWVRSHYPSLRFLAVGCANGMIGYLPTASALTEGGYEPERSLRMFGQPRPLAKKFEREVYTTLTDMIEFMEAN